MATQADSTATATRRLLPLAAVDRSASGPCTADRAEVPPAPLIDRATISREGWARARVMAVASGLPVRTHLAEAMRQAWEAVRAALVEAIRAGIDEASAPPAPPSDPGALLKSIRAGVETYIVEQDAAEARARHMRRALEAAMEHGAALFDALRLPRLVEVDFMPLDRQAIGDALHLAVATLDAIDGDVDAEPWLGWTSSAAGVVHLGDRSDREDDSEEHEGTALERHGMGFVRAGEDDAEDDDPGEEDFRGYPVDLDGGAEQLARTGLLPALNSSTGGHVA